MSKAKGAWSGGKAPAQGSTPQKISRPNEGTAKFGSTFAAGRKSANKGGAQK